MVTGKLVGQHTVIEKFISKKIKVGHENVRLFLLCITLDKINNIKNKGRYSK